MKKIEQIKFTIKEGITKEHIAHFKKYGIIQFKQFVDKETTNEFAHEIEKVQQQFLENGIKKVNGIPLKFGSDIDGSPLIQRIPFTSQYSTRLSTFLKDEKIKSLIKFLGNYDGRIGENEKDGLVLNHYVNSPYSKYTQLGWHTDSPRDLFLGSRILPMLNVGLHLDDCSYNNGGLRVLPGTHKQNMLQLLFKKRYFIDNNPDKKEMGFNIEAGDLTIHDGRIWHRVQQSPYIGEQSRRRVMYIPIITGEYRPKDANSKTPFYHKLSLLKFNPSDGQPKWQLGRAKKLALLKSTSK